MVTVIVKNARVLDRLSNQVCNSVGSSQLLIYKNEGCCVDASTLYQNLPFTLTLRVMPAIIHIGISTDLKRKYSGTYA